MAPPLEGLTPNPQKLAKTYSVSLACKVVGVSSRQLYYWESLGIVNPAYVEFGSYSYRRYSQEDIHVLRRIKNFMDEGYTLRAAAQKVTGRDFNGRNGGPQMTNGGVI